MWIGIQEHEQNVDSEYCAGTVNAYKCMISAGSDYAQHDKLEHKRNLETSETETFSSSELRFCILWYLLLQIASLLAEPTTNSRLQMTALDYILTKYCSSWHLWKHCVKSSHLLISTEKATIYWSLQSLSKQAEVFVYIMNSKSSKYYCLTQLYAPMTYTFSSMQYTDGKLRHCSE